MSSYPHTMSRVSAIKDYAWTNNYDSILVRIFLHSVDNDENKLREFANTLLGFALTDYRYLDFVVPGAFSDCVDIVVPVANSHVYKNTLPGVLYL